MTSLFVCDPYVAEPLITQRRDSGLDRYDEVWEGVYVMSPIADNEHRRLATALASVLTSQIDWKDLGQTLVGANVTDRADRWTENYRIPDVLVFLEGCEAEDRGTHWLGGPDFAVEIVSEGDRTLDKLGFYSKVGVRELLVIDRQPWKLTLYRRSADGKLELTSAHDGTQKSEIASAVLPIMFQLDSHARCIRILDGGGQLIRKLAISVP